MSVRKILILASERESDDIGLVNFLVGLKTLYKSAEINIIGDSRFGYISAVNEDIRFFPIDYAEHNLVSAYKFAYNLKDVFNIDIAFDFESSLISSAITLTIRPSKSVGLKKNILQNLYTYKLELKSDESHYYEFIKTVETLSLADYSSICELTKVVDKEKALFSDAHRPWRVCLFKKLINGSETQVIISQNIDEEEKLEFCEELVFLESDQGESKYLIFSQNKKDHELDLKVRGFEFGYVSVENIRKSFEFADVLITDLTWVAEYGVSRGLPVVLITSSQEVFDRSHEDMCRVFMSFDKEKISYFKLTSPYQDGPKRLKNVAHVMESIDEYFDDYQATLKSIEDIKDPQANH